MEVVSACPLSVGSLLWRAQSGALVLTVAAKATFQLKSIESPLAEQQDPIVPADRYWNDDPRQALVAASDLVPWKRRADVVIVGSAFAPFGEPVRSLVVRLSVAGADKAMEVFGDRVFSLEGYMREGAKFAKSPLDWRYAAGGPDTPNPVGIRNDAPRDTYGQRLLARFQPAGFHVASADVAIPAIGFGPIAPTWPQRWEKLYRHAYGWDPHRWFERPVPDDIDPGYFNVAPPDQQVDAIRADERIVLENLHPLLPRLVTSLAPATPQGVLERPGRPVEGVSFVCDTMWIDTDRQVCALTWRTRLLLASPEDPGRFWVTLVEAQAQAQPQPQAQAPVQAASPAPSAAGAPAQPSAGPAAAAAPAPPPARPAAPPPLPQDPNPQGLPVDRYPLEHCAAIAASYARRPADRAAILSENGLTEDDWDALDHFWSQALKRDAAKDDTRRQEAYDRAYVMRLEQERGPIRPEEYARLVSTHQRDRAALTRALSELGLPWGSSQRIERVFAERMAKSPELRAAVDAALKG
jgi:hypothetical protein